MNDFFSNEVMFCEIRISNFLCIALQVYELRVNVKRKKKQDEV